MSTSKYDWPNGDYHHPACWKCGRSFSGPKEYRICRACSADRDGQKAQPSPATPADTVPATGPDGDIRPYVADAPGAAGGGAGEPGALVRELHQLADKHGRPTERLIGINMATDVADRHEARWQADRTALGELLAIIFRDGGHRQAEIGDNAKAGEEAQTVVLADRRRADEAERALDELRAGLRGLIADLRQWDDEAVPRGYVQTPGMATRTANVLASFLPGPESAADARPAAGAAVESERETP